jgi:N-acylmannosamine kinase
MCGSGRFGTVESVAAGRAIAQAALASGYPDLDAKQVFERAGRGEKWAEDIVENSALAVTELCADLTIALGLEAIILAGSIGLADGYIDRVVQHFSKLPKDLRPILNSSTLGHEGPLLGALFDQPGQS